MRVLFLFDRGLVYDMTLPIQLYDVTTVSTEQRKMRRLRLGKDVHGRPDRRQAKLRAHAPVPCGRATRISHHHPLHIENRKPNIACNVNSSILLHISCLETFLNVE